jgi:hypothetical protein
MICEQRERKQQGEKGFTKMSILLKCMLIKDAIRRSGELIFYIRTVKRDEGFPSFRIRNLFC